LPDRRRHRGPHPGDEARFGTDRVPVLRRATTELAWLLGRGYKTDSALALVGDRHQLDVRQRRAVKRCACGDVERDSRRAREVPPESLRGATVWVDGFNVLTTVEAALAGGVLLIGRDGVVRDMASMHGSYRRVEETAPALEAIADRLVDRGVGAVRWLLDEPVSNSGRLGAFIMALAEARALDWTVDVVPDPDPLLIEAREVIVASADSGVLDAGPRSWQLARDVVDGLETPLWRVDLREAELSG